jgi:hypothetical protein
LNENVRVEPALAVEQSPTLLGWKESIIALLIHIGDWWQSYGQQWLIPGLAAVAIAYLLCLAGGTLLVRVATSPAGARTRQREPGHGNLITLLLA